MSLKAIVLAAGRGVRMGSDRPKVLQEVLGTPLVHYVLRAVREAGVTEIVVVVGHGAEEVRRSVGSGVTYVEQREQLGTGHAVLACREALADFEGDLLVLAGDAPLVRAQTLRGLIESHRAAGAEATMLTARLEDPSGYGRVISDAEGRLVKVVEDLDATPEERAVSEVNSGDFVLRARPLFEALGRLGPRNAQGEYYLPDALPSLARKNSYRAADPTEILGVNSRRDLARATDVLRRRILDRHMAAGVTIVDPNTTFIEDEATLGVNVVVHPFSIIRKGVTVGPSAEVGPFAHLRGTTVLEEDAAVGNFVEVKSSKIGRGSKAKHLAYLGDAELGERVNIGAGTITANYDGARKHRTVLEDGVRTGSNTVLIAPLRMGPGSSTGAGAVVLRGEVPGGTIMVGVPARPIKGRGRSGGPARPLRGREG